MIGIGLRARESTLKFFFSSSLIRSSDMEVLRLLVLPALCAAYGTARAPSGRHASRLAVDPAMAATTAFDLKARWPRHPAGPARRQPRTPSWPREMPRAQSAEPRSCAASPHCPAAGLHGGEAGVH